MPTRSREFVKGVKAAADVASAYDASSAHPYRLGDCIVAKLNVGARKPRKNRKAIDLPEESWLQGAAVALAEMHRRLHGGNDSTGVRATAKNMGITIARCKEIGVMPFDWQELKRAGVETGKARRKRKKGGAT
jgi:hypothetical protein